MKKSYLRNLAVLGITGGVILTAQELSAASASETAFSEQVQCGCRGGYIRQSPNQKMNPDRHGYGRNYNRHDVAMETMEPTEEYDDDEDSYNPSYSNPNSNSNTNSQYPSRYAPQNSNSNWDNDSNTTPNNSTQNNQSANQRHYQNGKPTAYRYSPRSVAAADEAQATNVEPESEEQFMKQLDVEGKRIYNSLSPEGKQMAQRLAKQYADKNQAVKHAQKQMSGMGNGNKGMDK